MAAVSQGWGGAGPFQHSQLKCLLALQIHVKKVPELPCAVRLYDYGASTENINTYRNIVSCSRI